MVSFTRELGRGKADVWGSVVSARPLVVVQLQLVVKLALANVSGLAVRRLVEIVVGPDVVQPPRRELQPHPQ